MVYNLPDVAIEVIIEAKKTIRKPGEFYLYATKYLKSTPIKESSELWELKSVTLRPIAVVNPEESYNVQFKSGQPVTFLLSESGSLLSVNDSEYNPIQKTYDAPQSIKAKPTILDSPIARQAMTQEMLQSTSVAKRAELAAAQIYELRRTRNDIISGNAENISTEGASMKLALDNLTAQEEALTAMFIGTETFSTEVVSFTYLPKDEDEKAIIARISPLEGIIPPSNLAGDPIYISYTVTRRGELPLNDKGEPKKLTKGALAYRIPGEANIKAIFNGKTVATLDTDIPALGVVFGLDASIFSDKKAPAYLHLNPLTGAIVETGTKNL